MPDTGRKISRRQKSVRWARSTYRVSLLVPGLLGVYSNRLLSMYYLRTPMTPIRAPGVGVAMTPYRLDVAR
eukprot:scaffold84141_cov30-Attheya_sp.AAC.1